MKIFKISFIYLIFYMFLFSCVEDTGDLHLKKNNETTFNLYNPPTGTFVFTQKNNSTKSIGTIFTYLNISTNNPRILSCEILGFNDDYNSFDKMIFAFRDTISSNQNRLRLLDSLNSVSLNHNKIRLAIFDKSTNSTNISGHYEGNAKRTYFDESGQEIYINFNLFGNIDFNKRLLLLPSYEIDSIGFYEGNYNLSNEFSGTVTLNDNSTIILTNHQDSFYYNPSLKVIQDTLNFTQNGIDKKLIINLQKMD